MALVVGMKILPCMHFGKFHLIRLCIYCVVLHLCRVRFPGFRIRVVCFDPELQDQEGCSLDGLSGNVLESLQVQKRSIPPRILSKKDLVRSSERSVCLLLTQSICGKYTHIIMLL